MMADREALVSVVIAVHNGGRHLAAAIDSVLAQRPGPVDVLVVDDGSDDDTAAVVHRYGRAVRYHHQANAGPNAARNAGVDRAEGRFLAFVDADDLWLPDKLERQLAAFEDPSGPEVVFGHVEEFVSPEAVGSVGTPVRAVESGAMPGYIVSTMLARRTSFLKVGMFDASLRAGELIDWIWRARLCGVRVAMLPAVVARRRLHAANLGRREPHARVDYLRAVKAALDRRRGRFSEREPT